MPVDDDYAGGIPEQPLPNSAANTIIAYRVGVVEKTLKDFVDGFDAKIEKLGEQFMTREMLAMQFKQRDDRLDSLEKMNNQRTSRSFSMQTIMITALVTLISGFILALVTARMH